jgi:hypothetical protein
MVCVIDDCEEGWANDTDNGRAQQMSLDDQANDGCEVRLAGRPVVTKNLGTVRGDVGTIVAQATYDGFGGGDFTFHVTESGFGRDEIDAQVVVQWDAEVKYSVEIEIPAERAACANLQGVGGVVDGPLVAIPGRGGKLRGTRDDHEAHATISWRDRHFKDDSMDVTVHVRYLGGGTGFSDGGFHLSVTAPPLSNDDKTANASWSQSTSLCTLMPF